MRRSLFQPEPNEPGTVAGDLKAAVAGGSLKWSERLSDKERGRSREPASLLAELESLDFDLLRKRWRSLLRTSVPRGLSRQLVIRILACREQVAEVGDLDKASLTILEAAASHQQGASTPVSSSRLRPGTVLVREHAAVLHRVAVLADGFAWNGSIFSSLSAVARAITGVNWNGPRFFGLDRRDAVLPAHSVKTDRKRKASSSSASSPASPTQPREEDTR